MSKVVRSVLAAVLVSGAVGLLGSCSDQSTAEQPVTPPTVTPPAERLPAAASDRMPMGLEIRYVDADGKVVILEPKDFPR